MWVYHISKQTWQFIGTGSQTPLHNLPFGEPGPASQVWPGVRKSSSCWRDSDGIFWLFGGSTVDATDTLITSSSIWSFNPVGLQWTRELDDSGAKKQTVLNTISARDGAWVSTVPLGDAFLYGGFEGGYSDVADSYRISMTCN